MPKFIVLFFLIYFQNLNAYKSKYCEICLNHTLCKYEKAGSSPTCLGYDKGALLTQEQIHTIVYQINKRRNFIATGQSKFFHPGANIKKIRWSHELSLFAQRWVDQCDQSLRPDKEDECRDLEKTKVGQIIATITGPSPGIKVKSFVEMWFILSMTYNGSVTYYNQSRDYKTNYFTQFIWAQTDEVGCGKARFYVNNSKTTIVERLVCNFAPLGNIHGKPIYTIGYPATQCRYNMIPDKEFPGLCSPDNKTDRLSSAQQQVAVTSLLRIRNIFKDSVKQEIDPVYSDLNQTFLSSKFPACPPSKKYEFFNIPYEAIKRSHPLDYDAYWTGQRNISKEFTNESHHSQRGHLKVHHDHNFRDEFDAIHPTTFFKKLIRHDFVSSFNYPHKNIKQCTRLPQNNMASTCGCKPKSQICTRTIKPKRRSENTEAHPATVTYPLENELCICAVRPYLCNKKRHLHFSKKPSAENMKQDNDLKGFYLTTSKYLRFNKRRHILDDHLYSESKSNKTRDERKFKSFWPVYSLKDNQHVSLKSLLFTTLPNKKQPRSKRTRSTLQRTITTEPITIRYTNRDKNKRITEKYLSFDELMHLRKYNSSISDGRRQNEQDEDAEKQIMLRNSDETTVKTNEYTANTPYVRIKFCTRKLTCTWTAASLTDSAGSIIPDAGSNAGSKTPPGYVEGCTRTSTCTRDDMDKNKFDTLSTGSTTPVVDINDADDDYCERRSLNKRNTDVNISLLEPTQQLNYTNKLNNSYYNNHKRKSFEECNCHEKKTRVIRSSINSNVVEYKNKRENLKQIEGSTSITYGDLYYLVLNKILEMWKTKSIEHNRKKCSCNKAEQLILSHFMLFIIVLLNK